MRVCVCVCVWIVPLGVSGAWETEIPRHDLMGYMKTLETLAVGGVAGSDADDSAAPIVVVLVLLNTLKVIAAKRNTSEQVY